MITVKELVPLLKKAKCIKLVWDSYVRNYDPDNVLDVDAYGDYVISQVVNYFEPEVYELCIAVCPVKEEK